MMRADTIVEIVSNAAMGFSALFVAGLSAFGFNTWRRKARAEAAQRLLGLARKAVNEIKVTRTAVTYSGEALDRQRDPRETPEQRRARDEEYGRMKRLEQPRKTLKDLYERSWEAEALLHVDLSPYIDPLADELNGIRQAILALFAVDSTGTPVQVSPEECKQGLMKIYGGTAAEDTVGPALDKAFEELRQQLKKHL